MNLILCYPPKREYPGYGQDKRWLPLGISALGAYIKRELPEVDVTLLDLFDYAPLDAVEEVKRYLKPGINLVGFTCFTEQRMSALGMCQALKTRPEPIQKSADYFKPEVYTILGGPHASIMAEQIAETYDFVDFIVKGEGEIVLKGIIEQLQQGEKPSRITQSKNCKALSELPHAIDGFDLFTSRPTHLESEAPIVFSRGCTDTCSFCSTTKFWKGYRTRTAGDVFAEMTKFNQRYGTTQFKFHDDSCTANLGEWKKLCQMIMGKGWTYEITARADQFDDELISLLSQSGCKSVAVGIESGSEALRKRMNKRLDIDKAKKNITKLKKAGIEVTMLLIVGYPGETEETIKETCSLIREVVPTAVNKMPLMIFPGTKVYRELRDQGWIKDEYWLVDVPQPFYTKEVTKTKLWQWVDKISAACRPVSVLLCAPVREKEEIFKLYLDNIRKLKKPDWLILDKLFIFHNSEDLKELLLPGEKYHCINTNGEYKKDDRTHYWEDANFNAVVAMKNTLLRYALENGYDYIFFVDSDLILQPETLQSLYDADKDVIAEVFWTLWDKSNPNMKPLPNAWRYDSYHLVPEEVEQWKEPGLYRVGMTGACTLIKRKVLEAGVNWNPINNVSFTTWEDRAFCIRAAVHGFQIWLDTHNPAFHIYRDEELQKYLEMR